MLQIPEYRKALNDNEVCRKSIRKIKKKKVELEQG
jgi:hypothetical protein